MRTSPAQQRGETPVQGAGQGEADDEGDGQRGPGRHRKEPVDPLEVTIVEHVG